MQTTLWSHDFTIITLGTLISAIGSTAMSFALSLVVFDETGSTFLTGLYTAVSLMPSIVVPILAAPYVDRMKRKYIIVGIDMFNGCIYLLFAVYLYQHSFSYVSYLVFSLIIGCSNAVYSLAYQALYPDLIPKGFAQKGYSVSSMIYPSVTALFTPIASFIYIHYGVAAICLLEGFLLIIASMFECRIKHKETRYQMQIFSFSQYKKDLKEGFHYLHKEKGIKYIYSYMATTNATGNAVNMMTMAMFQSTAGLSTPMFAFLTTAETAGRMLGGIVHYFIKIPYQRRYQIAVRIYTVYEMMDCCLLFIAYPFMIINRFIVGFLGINSLNIREASTQNFIPGHLRARVNGLFNVFLSFMMMAIQLIVGVLGEYLPYQVVALGFSSACLLAIYVIIVRNKKDVEPVYNQQI